MRKILKELSAGEKIRYGVFGYVGACFIFYLFFESPWIFLPAAVPGMLFFLWYMAKRKKEKNKWELMVEFKDLMESMVSALTAGYSMENALREAEKDLKLMYGKEKPVLKETGEMIAKLDLGKNLDDLFMSLGKKSGVEDIVTFAEVYKTARRSGGNLIKVMKRTANAISEKIEIEREVKTMISGKRMESICMMVIPLFIILYMKFFSPGFLDPLYNGFIGRAFMTGALLIYVAAVLWSRKIMNIKF